jgi:hypothetical protein
VENYSKFKPLVTNAAVLSAIERVKQSVAERKTAVGQLQHTLVALYQVARHEHVDLRAGEVSAMTSAERSYCSRVWRACRSAEKAGADLSTEMEAGAALFIDKWLPSQQRRVTKRSSGSQKLLAKIKAATKAAKRVKVPANQYAEVAGAVLTLFEALQTEDTLAPDQAAAQALISRAHTFVTGNQTVQ